MKRNRPASASGVDRFRISKAGLIGICLAVLALSLVYAIFRRLAAAPLFLVQEVIVRQDGSVRTDRGEFGYLRARNMFALDLPAEARRICRSYPGYQQVRVARFFPDRIFVDFITRQPLACVRGTKTWYLDENQVVFELPEQAAVATVPAITGIERTFSSADSGRRLENAGVSRALFVILQVKGARALRGYTLARVDVASRTSLSLFWNVPAAQGQHSDAEMSVPAAGLHVKIGQENIRQQLQVLATLLAQVSDRLYSIEYIDLRFREPVIKFKERT